MSDPYDLSIIVTDAFDNIVNFLALKTIDPGVYGHKTVLRQEILVSAYNSTLVLKNKCHSLFRYN